MQSPKSKSRFLFSHYEHKSEPVVSRKIFFSRVYRNCILATVILGICLLIGIVGYKYLGPMNWIDALHNAAMILGGMGPVVEIRTVAGKLFSSFYALFSGVAFITNFGILIAPLAHRFFHILHAEDGQD